MLSRANLPTLALSLVALFAALSGGAIAAKEQERINGKVIRAKSIPGNRIALRSIPMNRLKPGVVKALGAPISEAPYAATADSATTAVRASTAGHADTAGSAGRADQAGHAASADTADELSATCPGGTRAFSGACWQESPHAAASATSAAATCASQGGELPDTLQLVAFAAAPGVSLASAGEWSASIATLGGPDAYTVATVDEAGTVDGKASTGSLAYRCVLPLLRP